MACLTKIHIHTQGRYSLYTRVEFKTITIKQQQKRGGVLLPTPPNSFGPSDWEEIVRLLERERLKEEELIPSMSGP